MNDDRLKFRVWDKKINKFWDVGLVNLDSNGKMFYIGVNEKKEKYFIDCDDDFVFQKCIDRKDKNGKLIFELDIAKGYFDADKLEDWMWLQLTDVEKKRGYKIYLVDNIHFGYEYPVPNTLEVIGNRFENPELLEN
jgi:uncharacterized phage protein (TIGR01671 family)